MKISFLPFVIAVSMLPAVSQAKTFNLFLNFGQDVELISKKDVSLHATCLQNETIDTGNDFYEDADFAIVYAKTTATKAILEGENSLTGNGEYLTAESEFPEGILLIHGDDTGIESFDNDTSEGYVLSLDTMRGFTVQGAQAILAVNPNDQAGCLISVNVEKVKRFKTVK